MKRSARVAATAARAAVQELCGPSSAKIVKPKQSQNKSKVKASTNMANSTTSEINNDSTNVATTSRVVVDDDVSSYFPAATAQSSKPSSKKKKSEAILTNDNLLTANDGKRKVDKNPLRLGREFFDQDAIPLCRALLGTVLCRKIASTGEILRGTIVEMEAYPGNEDKASQSFGGRRTARNEAMYMQPGTAYVYFTYGMYFCFNISSRGDGSACLIRGIEPLEGYETMHHLRSKPTTKKKVDSGNDEQSNKEKKKLNTHQLANGPSKLCIAFDISRDKLDKCDMVTSDELWIETSRDLKFKNKDFEVAVDKRIGIESAPPEARNKLWRFYVKDSWAESKAKIGELKKKAKLLESQQI